MRQVIVFLCVLLGLSACSPNKGYFSIHQSPQPIEQKTVGKAPKEPILLAIGDQSTIAVLPDYVALSSEKDRLTEVQENRVSLAPMPTARLDKQVSKKEVKALIQHMKSQTKLTRQSSSKQASSASSWDPKLKIGLILLGLGIILSIFGLGLIGGLSALIGLAFTIIGLLHTY